MESSGQTEAGDDRWLQLISAAVSQRPTVLEIAIPVGVAQGTSRPARVVCNDGQKYVTKGRRQSKPPTGRMLFADQVVGRLAAFIDAPVPEVVLINVPAELIDSSYYLLDWEPGIAHGSVQVAHVEDSRDVLFQGALENKPRFASLAVLYGWTVAADHQFLYEKQPPRPVWSADHGDFLFGGPDGTVDDFVAAPVAAVHPIVTEAMPGRDMLVAAVKRLALVSDRSIAFAVALPPDSWGVTMEERTAIARGLAARRDLLVASVRIDG